MLALALLLLNHGVKLIGAGAGQLVEADGD
jgi:hypothetical protein